VSHSQSKASVIVAERVFLNDRIVDADKACISPSDAGLLHGVGLFETIRVYAGRAFRLDQHIERLLNSAAALDLVLRHSDEAIREAAAAVIDANKVVDGRMRITVTGGPLPTIGPDGEGCPSPPQSTLLVAAAADAGYPADFYNDGMAVATAAARVNPADLTVAHKTLNYWPRLLTLQASRQQHCGEALWFTIDNRLAEGCVSNAFLVAGGRVLTPSLDTPILPGIARATVLEICRDESIPAEEASISRDDVAAADEVFLTNSVMEVMPIVQVERRTIGDGKPGPITRRIAELYRDLVKTETSA
jgi:branched-chain amino acid aminotransferase